MIVAGTAIKHSPNEEDNLQQYRLSYELQELPNLYCIYIVSNIRHRHLKIWNN